MPKDSTTKQAKQDSGGCEPVTSSEIYRLSVLLTATDANVLGPFDDSDALPAYLHGPRWDVRPASTVDDDEYFDLAIVLCATSAQLGASEVVARSLAARRNPTLLLLPAVLAAGFVVPGATVLTVPGSLVDGLAILGAVVLAATQHEGDVCCDLADIISVLDAGARGELFMCEAPTAKGAIAGLQWEIRHIAPSSGYGAVLTLQHGNIRQWYILMNMVKELVREDAMVIGSHPLRDGEGVRAAAMVITLPSTRYIG